MPSRGILGMLIVVSYRHNETVTVTRPLTLLTRSLVGIVYINVVTTSDTLLTLVLSVVLNFFLSLDIEIGCLFLFCCALESPSYWGD